MSALRFLTGLVEELQVVALAIVDNARVHGHAERVHCKASLQCDRFLRHKLPVSVSQVHLWNTGMPMMANLTGLPPDAESRIS